MFFHLLYSNPNIRMNIKCHSTQLLASLSEVAEESKRLWAILVFICFIFYLSIAEDTNQTCQVTYLSYNSLSNQSVSETICSNSCQPHNLFRDIILNDSPWLSRRGFGSPCWIHSIPIIRDTQNGHYCQHIDYVYNTLQLLNSF